MAAAGPNRSGSDGVIGIRVSGGGFRLRQRAGPGCARTPTGRSGIGRAGCGLGRGRREKFWSIGRPDNRRRWFGRWWRAAAARRVLPARPAAPVGRVVRTTAPAGRWRAVVVAGPVVSAGVGPVVMAAPVVTRAADRAGEAAGRGWRVGDVDTDFVFVFGWFFNPDRLRWRWGRKIDRVHRDALGLVVVDFADDDCWRRHRWWCAGGGWCGGGRGRGLTVAGKEQRSGQGQGRKPVFHSVSRGHH